MNETNTRPNQNNENMAIQIKYLQHERHGRG